MALQRGLQLNLKLQSEEAAFYRVYEHDGVTQTALVLLNKGDAPRTIDVKDDVQAGEWRDAFDGRKVKVGNGISLEVPAHGVRVLFFDQPLTNEALRERLADAMARKDR